MSERKFVYKVYTDQTHGSPLRMVKEYAESYQMDPDSWKPSPEEAIIYYKTRMYKYVHEQIADLKKRLIIAEKSENA